MLLIENFLDETFCEEIRAEILSLPFRDGKRSARTLAASVKNNLELDPVAGQLVLKKLEEKVIKDQRIKNYAFPAAISSPLIVNLHKQGMAYGNHTDSALNGNFRTDISFTIFLEKPENYAGGALVIERPDLPFPIVKKAKLGSIFLYSTGPIHRVNDVTKGSRLACVGWLESRIREEAKRSLLRELMFIRQSYYEKCGHDEIAELFVKSTNDLIRMWA